MLASGVEQFNKRMTFGDCLEQEQERANVMVAGFEKKEKHAYEAAQALLDMHVLD